MALSGDYSKKLIYNKSQKGVADTKIGKQDKLIKEKTHRHPISIYHVL